MNKPVVITVSAVAVAAIATVGIIGVSQRGLLEELLTHQKEVSYTDRAALETARATESQPDGATKPRAWMAPDAKQISVRFVTTAEPGWDIRYTSTMGLDASLLKAGDCRPVAKTDSPAIDASWLPDDISGKPGYFCASDAAYVTQKGGTVYGWQSADQP